MNCTQLHHFCRRVCTYFLLASCALYPAEIQKPKAKPQIDVIAAVPDAALDTAFSALREQVIKDLDVKKEDDSKSRIITGKSGAKATFSISHKEYHARRKTWKRVLNEPHITFGGIDKSMRQYLTDLCRRMSIEPVVYLGLLRATQVVVFRGEGTAATDDDKRRAYVALKIAPQAFPDDTTALQAFADLFNQELKDRNLHERQRTFKPHITIATIVPRTFKTKHDKTRRYAITDADIAEWNQKVPTIADLPAFYIDSIILKYWGPGSEKEAQPAGLQEDQYETKIWSRTGMYDYLNAIYANIKQACTRIKKRMETKPDLAFLMPQLTELIRTAGQYHSYMAGLIKTPRQTIPPTLQAGFLEKDLYRVDKILKEKAKKEIWR